MQNTAPKGGAGSDDPIGRHPGRNRPTGHCGKCIVRTGSSNGERIGSFDDNQSCLCSSSRWSSSSSSTEIVDAPGSEIGSRAVDAILRNPPKAAGDLAVREAAGRRAERRRPCYPDWKEGNESAVAVAVAGAVRYRTLHLWAAMVRTATNHRLKRSTSISGVSS